MKREMKQEGAPPAQSKASHTPGPWRYEPPGTNGMDDEGGFYAGADFVMHFGSSAQYDCMPGEGPSDADAKLIAAAPVLADALEAILRWRECDRTPTAENIADAHAALRLAGRLP